MSDRKDSLRAYLLDVTRDLVKRGLIRKHSGQSMSQILETEMYAVVASVIEDLKSLGGEVIGGLVQGMLSGLFGR
jgi:hypothetical protein